MWKPTQIHKNIAEYMSSMGKKQFSPADIQLLYKAYNQERSMRKALGVKYVGTSSEGKKFISNGQLELANRLYGSNYFTLDDISLFKKAEVLEFEDRTGKCAWGFKATRKRYGADINSGKFIDTE